MESTASQATGPVRRRRAVHRRAAAPGTSGRTHAVVDPATGEEVLTLRAGGRRATSTPPSPPPARRFPGWAGATPGERSDALHRLRRRAGRAGRRLRLRRVAPVRQADQAVRRSSTCRAPSTTPPSSPAPPATCRARRPASTPATTPRTSAASRSASSAPSRPWNYPLQMAAWKILPAIAAGNTIVLKPAELTPLTSLMFAQAGHRGRASRTASSTSSPAPGQDAGEHLVGHPDVAMTSFTGSTAVGKRVAEIATAHRQARCTWSSAARRPSSSSTTPTWRPPSTARSPAR